MKDYFKLLVCGSRYLKDKEFVFKTLDFLLSKKDISNVILIHGAQISYDGINEIHYGADYLADLWAKERKVIIKSFPAPWEGLPDTPKDKIISSPYGYYWKGAGPYRNNQMLEENPNGCVAFFKQGFKNLGTNNMVKLCENKGILTKKYYL